MKLPSQTSKKKGEGGGRWKNLEKRDRGFHEKIEKAALTNSARRVRPRPPIRDVGLNGKRRGADGWGIIFKGWRFLPLPDRPARVASGGDNNPSGVKSGSVWKEEKRATGRAESVLRNRTEGEDLNSSLQQQKRGGKDKD